MTSKAQNSDSKRLRLEVQRRGIVIYGPNQPTISDLYSLVQDLLREGASFSDTVQVS